jgi:hypothetical protein
VSSDAERYRAKARQYTEQAQQAPELEDRVYLARMARSYMLMAKNADWLNANRTFLQAVRDGKRWPAPDKPAEQGAPKAAGAR